MVFVGGFLEINREGYGWYGFLLGGRVVVGEEFLIGVFWRLVRVVVGLGVVFGDFG